MDNRTVANYTLRVFKGHVVCKIAVTLSSIFYFMCQYWVSDGHIIFCHLWLNSSPWLKQKRVQYSNTFDLFYLITFLIEIDNSINLESRRSLVGIMRRLPLITLRVNKVATKSFSKICDSGSKLNCMCL